MRARFVQIVTIMSTMGLAMLNAAPVMAQAANCAQIAQSVDTLERNDDFRNLNRNTSQIRNLADRLRDWESQFVRGGCQAALKANQTLNRQCRQLASSIVDGRKQYNALAQRVETGQAIAQQREAALQQKARFGCPANSAGSNARFSRQTQQPTRRSPFQEFLDRVFGGGSRVVDPYGNDYYNQNTLRTVCVRSCDGYYWPVSFSTLDEYLDQDASICQQQCPGEDVQLYYYHNPGEDAEQMVSLSGQLYSALPNAFRYRTEYDASCTCHATQSYGTIQISEGGRPSEDVNMQNASMDAATGRAVVSFGETSFPLPLRDPRRKVNDIVVAEPLLVPLPRKRPNPNAEAVTVASSESSRTDQRIINWGDKRVRIVGPDTPYARVEAKGL